MFHGSYKIQLVVRKYNQIISMTKNELTETTTTPHNIIIRF